ncbi:MAG: amidase family protein [Actinobacteria bacterium]|nr:amidase family protein [Actinomycetota bacterium]
MQLTIIGAGAIGGTIGAHLIRAGHNILFCDTDSAHVDALNSNGITIEGPVENFTVKARAVLPEDLPEKLERVAIAVKSHHTKSAAELLRNRLTPNGYVVTWQNGLTANELSEVVGAERVIVSFVNFGADYLAPGRIMQGNIGTFRIGELVGNEITPRVRELVDALPYAQATENILGFLWGKEAYGAMLYAGAVSDLSIADALDDPRWRPLMKAIAREVLVQAPVKPESFDGFDPSDIEASLDRLVTFNRASAKTHSGIYRDLTVRKRKTEVDDLMRDLKGPLTNYVGTLIQSVERGERICEVANLELLAAYERCERLGRPLGAISKILEAPLRAASGPLHGIQIAVKDIIDIKGQPRGNGNPEGMKSDSAKEDAPVIARLRELGADVFVATSLLEYAAGATHPDIPEAMNPYNPERTAGGSSGGSAALVGAGVCEVALGTDTGGSIRIPAHYCAVVGFKPSFGALPIGGVTPLSPTFDHVGLLANNVATTARVFNALVGESKTIEALPINGLRIGYIKSQLLAAELQPNVRKAITDSLDALKDAGATLVEIEGTPFASIEETFGDILLYEAWQVHGSKVESAPEHYGPETLRLLQSAREVNKDSYQKALARRIELLPSVAAIYDDIDLLLTPCTPYVAPATTPPVDTPEGAAEGMFTGIFNITGDPAISIPCGWSEDGLPIGLQLSTLIGTDQRLLAGAGVIEKILAPLVARKSH